MANSKITQVQLKKSSDLNQTGNGPKLPTPAQLVYGELAINYAKGYETISLKNSANEIVTISAKNDDYVTKEQLIEDEAVIAGGFSKIRDVLGVSEKVEFTPSSDMYANADNLTKALDIVGNAVIKESSDRAKDIAEVKTIIEDDESVIADTFLAIRESVGLNNEVAFTPNAELIKNTTNVTGAVDTLGNTLLDDESIIANTFAAFRRAIGLTEDVKYVSNNSIVGGSESIAEAIFKLCSEVAILKNEVEQLKSRL